MSNSSDYYESIKALAREKRLKYGVVSKNLSLSLLRNIYKAEGIKIKYAKKGVLRKLKAAYCNDEDGIDVLLNPQLPDNVKIFALIHELKHHYTDAKEQGILCLKAYGEEPLAEKSAEVFAAEFIWSEEEFLDATKAFGLTKENCSPENIVKFKFQSGIPVSYKFVTKRLTWFGLIQKGQYDKTQFQKLQDEIFGKPFYRR